MDLPDLHCSRESTCTSTLSSITTTIILRNFSLLLNIENFFFSISLGNECIYMFNEELTKLKAFNFVPLYNCLPEI